MANPMSVIDKLQQIITLRYEATRDDLIDVPYVDDEEYKTHHTYGEQKIEEAKDEDEEEAQPVEEAPPEEGDEELLGAEGDPATADEIPPEGASIPGEEGGEELAGAEMDPAAAQMAPEGGEQMAGAEGGDPTAAQMEPEGGEQLAGAEGGEMAGAGGDMAGGMGGDMGIPGQEEPLSPKEIGRAYELKKIYARLVSLEKYLTDITEPHLVELRAYVSHAVDLFRTITSNFESYKDRLDDIIVTFYKFLQEAYTILKKYYKKQIEED